MASALLDLAPLAPPLVYVIDGQDRIQAVNDAYVADVGGAGGDAQHVRQRLIGQVIWHVLPGVAEWYGPLVRRARAEQRTVCFPFRCDTPDLRRLMRMRIRPEPGGAISFESAVVRVQPRPHVPLVTATGDPGVPVVSMCSWCKRVDAAGDWLEVEDAMERLGADSNRLPSVSHGICPRCLDELAALAHSPDATLSIGLPAIT
ncbi:hypothetical protein [Luteitalea sp.]|jgi:hypothetical protein|uniref:hypothetical protein n=1 Tax=Luteitalea sp. TaxID=2004800 RepID=UPI0037C89FCF